MEGFVVFDVFGLYKRLLKSYYFYTGVINYLFVSIFVTYCSLP